MILSAILVIFFTPLVIVILQLAQRMTTVAQRASLAQGDAVTERQVSFRPGLAASWLISLVGIISAWLLILFSRPSTTYIIDLITWRPVTYFPDTLMLLVDPVSWSFSFALITLVLAVTITVPIRLQKVTWRRLASGFALGGVGLVSVLAGNPLTLMLSWAALDITEIIIYISQIRERSIHVRELVAFVTRIGSLGLLLWADVAASSLGEPFTFNRISAQLNIFLLLAAGLRLGVLPFHLGNMQDPPSDGELGASLRLVPAVACFILLTRCAEANIPSVWIPFLLVLVGFSAVYGAFQWFFAPDELQGRSYWILGMAALTLASAICGSPEAVLCWGLACIFSGGVMFMFSAHHRMLLPVIFLGLMGFSGLPYTPAWGCSRLYLSLPSFWFLPIFALAHALLLSGYIVHSLRPDPYLDKPPGWMWLFYSIGLILIPVSHLVWFWQAFTLSYFFSSPLIQREIASLPFLVWLVGAGILGFAVWIVWLRSFLQTRDYRLPALVRKIIPYAQGFFSLGWLYTSTGILLRALTRGTHLVSGILEGDAGILWVMVLLVLVIALLMQGGQL